MVEHVERRGGPWIARDRWGWPDWRLPVVTDGAHRRAGGRRRYNAHRRRSAELRRERVLALMAMTAPRFMTERGWQARTARELGVSRATVCRDVDALLAEMFGGREPIRITFRLLRAVQQTPAPCPRDG